MTPPLALLARVLRLAPHLYPAISVEPEWRALLTEARAAVYLRKET